MGKIGEAGYVLTLHEYVYLAALTGAEVIYGIEDDTYRLSQAKIREKWNKVKQQLENKKYIEIELDGAITIDNDLFKLIHYCCHPKMFIVCQGRWMSGERLLKFFYLTEAIPIELEEDRLIKNTYILTPLITVQKMLDNIRECIVTENDYKDKKVDFSLTKADYEEIKTNIQQGNKEEVVKEIVKNGCPSDMALDLYIALKEKKYLSTILVKIKNEDQMDNNSFTLYGGHDYLWKISSVDDDIIICSCNSEQIMSELEYQIGGFKKSLKWIFNKKGE